MQQQNETDLRVDNLINLTHQLTGLLDSEELMLNDHRPSEIQSLNDEKAKVSALYQRELMILKSDPSKIKALAPAKRDALKSSTAEFRKSTDRHLRLLQNFRRVSEGIVKSVADEVSAKDIQATGYGDRAMAPKPKSNAPRAFAINQVI